MESVPSDYITQLDVSAGMDGTVALTAHSARKGGAHLNVSIFDTNGHIAAKQTGNSDKELTITVDSPKL